MEKRHRLIVEWWSETDVTPAESVTVVDSEQDYVDCLRSGALDLVRDILDEEAESVSVEVYTFK